MKSQTILIPFTILIISCVLFSYVKESFVPYTIFPFNYIYTGSDPLEFYNKPRYRKPYRWPFRYISSYPNTHCSPLL